MRNQQAGRVFILCLLLLTGYLAYLVFKPFTTAFAWAAFLAIPFWPVYSKLKRILRGRVTLAAILTTFLITALILVPAVVLVSSLASAVLAYLPTLETAHAKTVEIQAEAQPGVAPAVAVDAAGGVESGAAALPAGPGAPAAPAAKYKFPLLGKLDETLSRYFDMSHVNLEAQVAQAVKRLGLSVVDSSTAFLGNALNVLATFLMTMFMLVVFFMRGAELVGFLKKFTPLSDADQQAVLLETREMVRAIFYGVIMTAAIQAIAGGIGWKISGLSSPLIFGVAMFFCALVPAGGAALIWAPGAAWLLYQGHTVGGIFLIAWGVLVVSMLDNVLRPYFISGKTSAPTIPVMIGIFGGVAAFGMTGLFIGPLVVALFLIVLGVVERDFLGGEGAGPPTPLTPPGPPAPAA